MKTERFNTLKFKEKDIIKFKAHRKSNIQNSQLVSNYVSCVYNFFLILVPNELFNTKYEELNFFYLFIKF